MCPMNEVIVPCQKDNRPNAEVENSEPKASDAEFLEWFKTNCNVISKTHDIPKSESLQDYCFGYWKMQCYDKEKIENQKTDSQESIQSLSDSLADIKLDREKGDSEFSSESCNEDFIEIEKKFQDVQKKSKEIDMTEDEKEIEFQDTNDEETEKDDDLDNNIHEKKNKEEKEEEDNEELSPILEGVKDKLFEKYAKTTNQKFAPLPNIITYMKQQEGNDDIPEEVPDGPKLGKIYCSRIQITNICITQLSF